MISCFAEFLKKRRVSRIDKSVGDGEAPVAGQLRDALRNVECRDAAGSRVRVTWRDQLAPLLKWSFPPDAAESACRVVGRTICCSRGTSIGSSKSRFAVWRGGLAAAGGSSQRSITRDMKAMT